MQTSHILDRSGGLDIDLAASKWQLCFACSSHCMLDKVILVSGKWPQYTAGQCKGWHVCSGLRQISVHDADHDQYGCSIRLLHRG